MEHRVGLYTNETFTQVAQFVLREDAQDYADRCNKSAPNESFNYVVRPGSARDTSRVDQD